jgi:hypothetical protein
LAFSYWIDKPWFLTEGKTCCYIHQTFSWGFPTGQLFTVPSITIIPLEEVQLESDLIYKEKPIKILDTAERNTRTKTIRLCKVQWSHHTEEEATWEREENLREDHPHLFASHSKARGRASS